MATSARCADADRRVVVVLSGAGTRSRGRYPTLALPTDYVHRQVTERLYRAIGGDELVHPPWLGLAPPDWTYSWIRPVLERKLAKYPGRRFLFVGHSLGGYLGALFAHGHTDLDIATVAIGSPFGAVTGMPGTGRVFAEGTEHLRQHRQALGDRAPSMTLIASDGDRLVRAPSALPVMPGAKRVLLTTDRQACEPDPERVVVDSAPGHLALINHPEVLARIGVVSASPVGVGAA
jgi:pimeloyl-ACP methyl ester carboxylesterase